MNQRHRISYYTLYNFKNFILVDIWTRNLKIVSETVKHKLNNQYFKANNSTVSLATDYSDPDQDLLGEYDGSQYDIILTLPPGVSAKYEKY